MEVYKYSIAMIHVPCPEDGNFQTSRSTNISHQISSSSAQYLSSACLFIVVSQKQTTSSFQCQAATVKADPPTIDLQELFGIVRQVAEVIVTKVSEGFQEVDGPIRTVADKLHPDLKVIVLKVIEIANQLLDEEKEK